MIIITTNNKAFYLIEYDNQELFIYFIEKNKSIIIVMEHVVEYIMFNNYYIKYFYVNTLIYHEYYNYEGYEHKLHGPSSISFFTSGNISSKEFKINGKFHNEEDASYILYNKNGKIIFKQYYLNGISYPYHEYLKKLK